MTNFNERLEEILNKVWDMGYQTHKLVHVKGNRIDEIEFRAKSTDEAKVQIKALVEDLMPEKKDYTVQTHQTVRGSLERLASQHEEVGWNTAISDIEQAFGLHKGGTKT